jgi:hypothetical protein
MPCPSRGLHFRELRGRLVSAAGATQISRLKLLAPARIRFRNEVEHIAASVPGDSMKIAKGPKLKQNRDDVENHIEKPMQTAGVGGRTHSKYLRSEQN